MLIIKRELHRVDAVSSLELIISEISPKCAYIGVNGEFEVGLPYDDKEKWEWIFHKLETLMIKNANHAVHENEIESGNLR